MPKYPELARKLYIKDTGAYTKTRPRKGQNLLTIRKNLIKQYDRHLSAEGKRTEQKGKEENRKERNRKEERAEEALPWEEGEDCAPTPENDSVLEFMNGKLGKGVVLLTQGQMTDLLAQMGLDSFDYYVERLADYILKNQCKIRNHYETILRWWNEDRSVK